MGHMKASFFLVLRAEFHNISGKLNRVRAMGVYQNKPSTSGADDLVLKLNLDIPENSFDAPTIDIKFKDNPQAVQQVVTDLQKWVVELSDESP